MKGLVKTDTKGRKGRIQYTCGGNSQRAGNLVLIVKVQYISVTRRFTLQQARW
jgi:hypothetical protein